MSETDYQQLVERVLQNVAGPTISTDTGLEVAQIAGQIAAQEEVQWADSWRYCQASLRQPAPVKNPLL